MGNYNLGKRLRNIPISPVVNSRARVHTCHGTVYDSWKASTPRFNATLAMLSLYCNAVTNSRHTLTPSSHLLLRCISGQGTYSRDHLGSSFNGWQDADRWTLILILAIPKLTQKWFNRKETGQVRSPSSGNIVTVPYTGVIICC